MTKTQIDNFRDLTAPELRQYISQTGEGRYVIIDVRQPFEYSEGHIPGALLFPLPELEGRLFELPNDKDLLFYCRSGGRSTAAAMLAHEAEVTQKSVYNLLNGMMGWDDAVVKDFPRVKLFETATHLTDMLHLAMNFEKGAQRFYETVIKTVLPPALADDFKALALAETAHAKMIFQFLDKHSEISDDFDTVYSALPGDILEGGLSFDQVRQELEKVQSHSCLGLIELALQIEHAAFDLYRVMAQKATDSETETAFLFIAQAEKGHIRKLTGIIPKCPR